MGPVVVGGPATVADELERWVDEADVDGLTVDDGGAAAGAEQACILAGEAECHRAVIVDEADEFARDLARQHHAHDVHRLGRRDAQAAAELALHFEPVEHRGDLRAAAVDDDGA